MPRQRIDNLGKIGLNTDVSPYDLPPQAWTRLFNCVTQDGALRSAPGERKLFNLQIKPLYHTGFVGPTGVQFIVVSDGAKVHAYNMQGVRFDLTPTTDWQSGFVSFTNLNGVLVVNSRSDGPFYWSGDTADKLVVLPGWDTNWRCREMVAFRYYLVALNMTETNVEYPHKVRWSNSAAEGSLPTLWVAAATNDAGSDLIGETQGPIVGGALVRDALWIVKEDAVYEMRWIGGEFIMQLSRLKNIGTRLQRGFAPLRGGLVIFTTSDLLFFDGTNSRSLVDMRVRQGLYGSISEELWDFSQVFVHEDSSQLFIQGVEAGFRQLSSALVWNFEEDTWGHRRLSFGYGMDAVLATVVSGLPTWDELGAVAPLVQPTPFWIPGRSWDEQRDGSWNKGVYQPSVTDVLLYESNDTDTAWWVALVAIANTDSDGQPKTCIAERVAIPIEGADGLAMVTEVWPEVRGDAPVEISIGSQMAANDAPIWDAPIAVTPGVTQSITPRLTGRYIAVRVRSQADGRWALGSLTLDWQRAGER
jgi:hypothetical protein